MPFWKKDKAIDPVCGMEVDPKKAAAEYEHEGTMYYFCAPCCKAAFSKDPEKFLTEGPQGMGHH
jgi:YHS domain-containing protein